MRYSSVIFDMNGVILDDERIHQQTWRELFAKYNKSLTEEQYKNWVFGRTDVDTIKLVFGKNLSRKEIDDKSTERINRALELVSSSPPYIEETVSLVRTIPNDLGLATGSDSLYANFILKKIGIYDSFKAITTAKEVKEGKPNPEIYLKTAAKMQIQPSKCIVIEDSISGIKAARKAGMYCIAIPTTHKKEELIEANIVVELSDLKKIIFDLL